MDTNSRRLTEIREDIVQAAKHTAANIGLTHGDVERLHGATSTVEPHIHGVSSNVLQSLLGDPETRRVIERAGLTAERALALFDTWLRDVFRGNYDDTHALRVFKIGLAHLKAGVDERLMICSIGAFGRELAGLGLSRQVAEALFWNLAVMVYSYEYVKALVLERAIGTSRELYRHLLRLYSKTIYQQLASIA